jgi:hypothetical protein
VKRTALVLFLLLAPSPAAIAAELLMIEQPGCSWCRRWHEQIGPGYPLTSEGRIAPLRRVDLRALPTNITWTGPVTATPTFVVVENGKEVGRLTGYPGAEFFYGMLAPLLAKLPAGRDAEVAKR